LKVIEPNTIHIWTLLKQDTSTENFVYLLSEAELKRAGKFRFKEDYATFVFGRAILKYLLGSYLSLNPKEIELQTIKNGKPYFENDQQLSFNISHSGDGIALAFGHFKELGVDIEYRKRKVEFIELAKRFFSKNEFEKLKQLTGEDLSIAFFNCWTRKEAFIKAKGDGLSFPLKEFEVSLFNNEETELLNTFFRPKEKKEWSLISFQPYENYTGALAVKGALERVEYFDANTLSIG